MRPVGSASGTGGRVGRGTSRAAGRHPEGGRRSVAGTLGTAAVGAAAAVAQSLPSVAVLGQWTPLRRLPGARCRWRGPGEAPQVALTFDDGPHPEGTPAVLDRLDTLGLPATFFVLGSAAAAYPELVAEIAARGHGLGIHGDRHEHHLLRSPRWIRRDLARASSTLAVLGHELRWYRPTYGQATLATFVEAARHGWETVLWSAWGREWATRDPAAVSDRVVRRLGPGAIVLLHDSDAFGPPGMWRTVVEALPAVAGELERTGLRAVPLEVVTGTVPRHTAGVGNSAAGQKEEGARIP